MQFLFAAPNFWSKSKLPLSSVPASRPAAGGQLKPEICGWYDSSFDLTRGLDVSEQDSDALFQLWQLSAC